MVIQFITPFISSVENVLLTMADLSVDIGRPSLKTENIVFGDVTGLISMVGDEAKGSFGISFTEPVIIELTQRMLKEEVTDIDATVTDMVGEITNMVAGSSKKLLSMEGYDFDMAIPIVISGFCHQVINKKKGTIYIPFSTDSGNFYIESFFEDVRKKPH